MRTILRTLLTTSATAMLFVGAGCISVSTDGSSAGSSGSDGGVFKTANRGDDWVQKTIIPSASGQPRSFAGANVAFMAQDPQDANALYVGTAENGMFYTYDGGETWQQPAALTRGRIPAIAVHPKDKCTLYVAIENKLLKSDDCSRTWNVTYLDARADRMTTQVVVDASNPLTVWITNSSGDLLRSGDAGASWASVKNLGGNVIKFMAHPSDARRMYAATRSNGVWVTADGGATWANMAERYKAFSGANEFYDMAVAVSDANTAIIASKYGLLRTADGGTTWAAIPLLTAPGTALIYSVAIDPRDASILTYGTSTLFYRSPNAGANWTTKRLPTSRTATVLLADRKNAGVIYMGVTRFK